MSEEGHPIAGLRKPPQAECDPAIGVFVFPVLSTLVDFQYRSVTLTIPRIKKKTACYGYNRRSFFIPPTGFEPVSQA